MYQDFQCQLVVHISNYWPKRLKINQTCLVSLQEDRQGQYQVAKTVRAEPQRKGTISTEFVQGPT